MIRLIQTRCNENWEDAYGCKARMQQLSISPVRVRSDEDQLRHEKGSGWSEPKRLTNNVLSNEFQTDTQVGLVASVAM